MTDWSSTKLKEICRFQEGYVNPSQGVVDYFGDEVKWIRANDLNDHYVYDTSRKLSKKGFESAGKSAKLFKPDTLVISKSGTIGRLGIIKDYMCGNRATINIETTEKADIKFIFYFLRANRESIEEMAVGSVQKNLYIYVLESLDIRLPPLPEQIVIAAVLSSLDDKINLLHHQNKTLETLAETLFRQWFVEEAQETWQEGRLGDILASIESGSRPKGGIDPELQFGIPSIGAESINGIGNYDFLKTKYVTEDFFKTIKRGVVKSHDVLVYKDGAYVGRKGMFGNGFPFNVCSVNEHVFILRGNDRVNQFFLYFLLQQDELSQLNANSAQPGLNQESMRSFEITIPPHTLINEFGHVVEPWINKIFFNSRQIQNLKQLRDNLLPKLMTGEVRVEI